MNSIKKRFSDDPSYLESKLKDRNSTTFRNDLLTLQELDDTGRKIISEQIGADYKEFQIFLKIHHMIETL